jgi:molybdopterin molybdotransferase
MLSIDEALKLVLDHTKPMPVERSVVGVLGDVLGESIVSDIDAPPHDKSIVDGYAVLSSDIQGNNIELDVLEEIVAGSVPTKNVVAGSATRIMTGAPLPHGADAVVMVEQTTTQGDRVVIHSASVKSGQNIMRRGSSFSRGQTVLQAGTVLRPIEIGVLAEAGQVDALFHKRPHVAVIATGNELVNADQLPGAGQIRNSNGPMLAALARQAAANATDLRIARDNKEALTELILGGLSLDIVLLSGGVSAGVLDLVPGVLKELGVQEVFHKVNLKPGKPLWFGYKDEGSHQALVFGLPGNPVSSLVCFELFVRPAIEKMRGLEPSGLQRIVGRLMSDHQQRGDRPTYWPAVLKRQTITPLSWKGSGDLRTLTAANCLAFFPAGEKLFRAGDEIEVMLLE